MGTARAAAGLARAPEQLSAPAGTTAGVLQTPNGGAASVGVSAGGGESKVLRNTEAQTSAVAMNAGPLAVAAMEAPQPGVNAPPSASASTAGATTGAASADATTASKSGRGDEPLPMSERSNEAAADGAPAQGTSVERRPSQIPFRPSMPSMTGVTGVTAFSVAARPGSAGLQDEPWLEPFFARAPRRTLQSVACTVVVGLILAGLDAGYAQRAAVEPLRFSSLVLATAGLIVPVSLIVAFGAACLGLLLHPDLPPSASALVSRLRSE
ncbi:MAG: hypothetical protein QM784_15995 [Polyangiaceae bacterium]